MKNSRHITRFTPGSIHELVVLALPLIMVSLSENLMIFFDRIILAHYSLVSLNAVTLASQAVEIFQFGLWALVSMSELFVAACYARNQLKEMAKPCWQMIYLSLFSLPIVFVLGHFTGVYLLPDRFQFAGLGYYEIAMYGVPLFGIITALSAFFVGQGKVKLILYSTIVINVINLILDVVLIFGIKEVIPALGGEGAAISAVVSLCVQVIWLFLSYISKKGRATYGTHIARFNYSYFVKCIKVGAPIALSHVCEMLAWLFIIRVIAQTNLKNFTIISIGSTLYLIYAIINDGLSRSLSTIISNHINAKNHKSISKTIRSGIGLLLFFLIVLAIAMFMEPNLILQLFNLSRYALHWQHDIKISFVFIWLYFLFSGLYWIYASILTANHRTKFIMVANIFGIWLLTALPIYFLARQGDLSAYFIWPIMCVYVLFGFVGIFIYYLRSLRSSLDLSS